MSRSAVPLTRRALAVVTTTVALAALLTACSGSNSSNAVPCLDDAGRYVPGEVRGQPVVTDDPTSKELEKTLQTERVDQVASGYVKTLDPNEATVPPSTDANGQALPDPTTNIQDLILLAGVGEGVSGSGDRLFGDQPPEGVTERTLDGQTVTVQDFSGDNVEVGIAYAQPCDTVFLISFAYRGGADAAVEGMQAMLDASEQK